jgi:hypothetical protein
MKTNLPKAQGGRIVKTVAKTVKNTSKPVTKPKVTIPKVDPRSGKPLSPSQIQAIKSGKKLTFHTVDEQNAARDLKKAVESRTNPKPPAKLSTYKNRQSDYEKALWESYQQKGGTVKKKFQNGGSTTKSFKNPLTGRTRVTEGWKEKPAKRTGTVPPRPGYAEKKVDVYDKKGDKIKTIDKTRMLTSAPKEDNKFLSRGRNSWAYTKKVTKYKE